MGGSDYKVTPFLVKAESGVEVQTLWATKRIYHIEQVPPRQHTQADYSHTGRVKCIIHLTLP